MIVFAREKGGVFAFSLGGLGLGCTYIPYFSLVRRGEVRWGGVGSRKEEGRIET
jgi:hypothetical protein